MKGIILSILLVIMLAVSAFAGSVSLKWDYPKDSEDKIDGFKIYFDKESHEDEERPTGGMNDSDPYDKAVAVKDKTQRQAIIRGLKDGQWYFRMTAYSTTKGESDFSEEASGKVKGVPSPMNLEIIGK